MPFLQLQKQTFSGETIVYKLAMWVGICRIKISVGWCYYCIVTYAAILTYDQKYVNYKIYYKKQLHLP